MHWTHKKAEIPVESHISRVSRSFPLRQHKPTWLHLHPLHLAHAIRPIPPWIALAESHPAGPMTAALVDAVHAVTEFAEVTVVAVDVATAAAKTRVVHD